MAPTRRPLEKETSPSNPPIFHHVCHLSVSGRVSTKITFAKKHICFDPSKNHPTTLETILQKHPTYHRITWRCYGVDQLRSSDLPAVGVSFAAANLESAGIFQNQVNELPETPIFLRLWMQLCYCM